MAQNRCSKCFSTVDLGCSMLLEIKTVPAVYAYVFYWILMLMFALSPLLWERHAVQVVILSVSLGAFT